MFKHTVKYSDFNGKTVVEDLYFHLSTPEMLDLQFNPMVDGDFDKFIKNGVSSREGRKLWTIFKLLIVNSYGRRSEDGSRFVKKEEFTEEFLNSPAFEKFFEWLLLDSPDGKHGKEFYNAIMPERIRGDLADLEKTAESEGKKKLSEMSHEELQKLYLEAIRNKPKGIEG